MYNYDRFVLLYDRNQHNFVKQIFSNYKTIKKGNLSRDTDTIKNYKS